MMKAARAAADDAAARGGGSRPIVIAVTVLTSMDAAELADTSVTLPMADQVGHLARLTQSAGLDGVVASPQEIRLIRERCGRDFTIVTPGIRGGASSAGKNDDQARTMSAVEAIEAGASYVVVGRPIVAAPDPRAAAERILQELHA
jgi:orotidine-5'-phosphate decarboxylase